MAAKKKNLHFVLRNVGLLPASLSLYQQILYAVGIGRMSRRSRLVSSVSSLVVRAARTGVRLCERSHLVRRPVGKSRAAAVAGRSCNSLMRPAGVSISTASSETPRSVCRTSRPPPERFPMPSVQGFPRWAICIISAVEDRRRAINMRQSSEPVPPGSRHRQGLGAES